MNKKRLRVVVMLNATIVIGEIIFGIIAKSMGLIADAFHNFSDVIALLIGYIALVLTQREVSEQMTYGYVRMEMMAGFINSFLLVIAMIYVIGESVRKILNPPEVEGIYMIIVAGIAFIANIISVIILKKEGHVHHAHNHNGHDYDEHTSLAHLEAEEEKPHVEPIKENMNIKAITLHLISDVAISLGVIIGGIVIKGTGITIIDPILSIGFALFIIIQAIRIGKRTFLSLIDKHDEDIRKLATFIQKFDGVKSVHGIHLTVPSSEEKFFSAHIVMDGDPSLCQVEKCIEKIRKELKKMGLTHIMIQPETEKYEQNSLLCDRH